MIGKSFRRPGAYEHLGLVSTEAEAEPHLKPMQSADGQKRSLSFSTRTQYIGQANMFFVSALGRKAQKGYNGLLLYLKSLVSCLNVCR